MRASHNRAVLTARAAARTVVRPESRPGTDLTVRPTTVVKPSGYVCRKSKRPGADKGQGEWRTVSANDRSGRDPKWSTTVYRNPAC